MRARPARARREARRVPLASRPRAATRRRGLGRPPHRRRAAGRGRRDHRRAHAPSPAAGRVGRSRTDRASRRVR